jgi:hypothetical protein
MCIAGAPCALPFSFQGSAVWQCMGGSDVDPGYCRRTDGGWQQCAPLSTNITRYVCFLLRCMTCVLLRLWLPYQTTALHNHDNITWCYMFSQSQMVNFQCQAAGFWLPMASVTSCPSSTHLFHFCIANLAPDTIELLCIGQHKHNYTKYENNEP